MHKKVVAVAAVALYVLLTFLASVVTDYHDRYFPASLGASSQIAVDLSDSALPPDEVLTELQKLNADLGLGFFKRLPDLTQLGAQEFVDLSVSGQERQIGWFGFYEPARIVGAERLVNSTVDGTYLVVNDDRLDEAVEALSAQGISVRRTDSSIMTSITALAQEPGFIAPVVAGCTLAAAMTVFWLAVRARSRALRVLAGASPLRIQVQDLGGFGKVLALAAVAVAGGSSLVVGTTRGWVYLPPFLTAVAVFAGLTFVISTVVSIILSSASWPNADLFARRQPAVASLRWVARGVQAVTMIILISLAGPAWAASQSSAQDARQLEAWNELADQVQLTFGMNEEYLSAIAPQVARVVSGAEAAGESALSYTIAEDVWQGDFGDYSAIALVNAEWLSLVGKSVGIHALESVPLHKVAPMVLRELGPSLELWRGGGATASDTVNRFAAFAPAEGVQYPTADGGSSGQLSFLDDVLVLVVPSIAQTFDAQNIVSLASTGNIIFTGANMTQERLRTEEIGVDGLADLGIKGTLRTVYVAEQGILEGQFAAYLAQLLAISVIAMAIAFLVSAAVNAMISGLLNARRDFPLLLNGSTWESAIRPRALRDVGVGGLIAAIVILTQPNELIGVTIFVALFALAALYISHLVAAQLIFDRVAQRKL